MQQRTSWMKISQQTLTAHSRQNMMGRVMTAGAFRCNLHKNEFNKQIWQALQDRCVYSFERAADKQQSDAAFGRWLRKNSMRNYTECGLFKANVVKLNVLTETRESKSGFNFISFHFVLRKPEPCSSFLNMVLTRFLI